MDALARAPSLSLTGLDPRRAVARVAQGVMLVECGWVLWTLLGRDPRFPVGCDYRAVTDAARTWLTGGAFYPAYQLAGPYTPASLPSPIMYPPVALWLFAPFTVLPAWLWWVVPALAVGWALNRLRPAWWAWPVMALLWAYPRAPEAVMNGNPVIWAVAAVSVGVVVSGPAALALFKPTLIPFALVGIRSRGWWLVLALGIAAALPFAPLWPQYLQAIANLHAPLPYLWHDYPLLAIPLVARRT